RENCRVGLKGVYARLRRAMDAGHRHCPATRMAQRRAHAFLFASTRTTRVGTALRHLLCEFCALGPRLCPPFCNEPSVTGLDWSIPFFALSPSPSTRFCPGSARGRHLMGYEEDRPTNLRERARKPHWVGNGLTCPSSRRGDFASGRLVSWPAREP